MRFLILEQVGFCGIERTWVNDERMYKVVADWSVVMVVDVVVSGKPIDGYDACPTFEAFRSSRLCLEA